MKLMDRLFYASLAIVCWVALGLLWVFRRSIFNEIYNPNNSLEDE